MTESNGKQRPMRVLGNKPGEPGFEELYGGENPDLDKLAGTPEYVEAARKAGFLPEISAVPESAPNGARIQEEIPEIEAEIGETRFNIPYEKFIENVDGYLTGYLYAKQELEKLEAERKPSRMLGTDFQPGFNQARWKELSSQIVRMSIAFRVFRNRALTDRPELKELFDQFNESKQTG